KSKGQIKRSQPSAAPTVGSRSAQEQGGCQAAFAGKPAPTGFCGVDRNWSTPNVQCRLALNRKAKADPIAFHHSIQ
ncbi:hypothetical protein, partial [Pseudomonas siliginis]|uniref:hypothetical protein n=1 Tax=Pseudomonas siliginis TaxID=2842346 RepID=UPI001C85495B